MSRGIEAEITGMVYGSVGGVGEFEKNTVLMEKAYSPGRNWLRTESSLALVGRVSIPAGILRINS